MASISQPASQQNLAFSTARLTTQSKRPFYPPSICRCSNASSDNNNNNNNPTPFHRRWNAAIQDVFRNAVKRFDSVTKRRDREGGNGGVLEEKKEGEDGDGEWDWDRWKKHFQDVDEQERILSILKSQLNLAVHREDYEEAARLKVAIAAAAMGDTVGRVMARLNRAVIEERYQEAVLLRDEAGAGLVGWWSGISEDVKDPYGLIIRITAEHGRYVARSYSPRQLATSAAGAPLFEIFLTVNKKGQYKKQAVYLKWREFFQDSSTMSSKTLNTSRLLNPQLRKEDKSDVFVESTEDEEDRSDTDNDSDIVEEPSGFQSILRDMIPGLKVKVLKVTLSGKVDKDLISKVIEQIMDEEEEEEEEEEDDDDGDDDENDIEEGMKVEDEIKAENDLDKYDTEMDSGGSDEIIGNEEGSEIAVKVVIGDTLAKLSGGSPVKESSRFPAKLETKGRSTFSLRLEKDTSEQDSNGKEFESIGLKARLGGKRSIDNLVFDLVKSIEKEKKISAKVLKDVGELLSLTLGQAQNRQELSGLTTFRRIDATVSPDPLDGLYIGAHGLYTSEVINLKRKFGQWKDDDGTKKSSDLDFYEYVEAVKLTGDPYVPAGKVAFRAKIGKRYQLPHKGIIPEELGVIARYKGQGRLAEPGFRNPRWVDGELVILDGKYVKGGPVVGFVYWAPEYHFLVFFNRLRLQP